MSMPIEAFLPCLGEVKASVNTSERNVPVGCCPSGIENSKILTKGADIVSEFEITYQGTLFALIDDGETWKVETWLENVGGKPDKNERKKTNISHKQTALQQTIKGEVSFNYSDLVPGDMYKMVYKVELKVNGVLIVCGFSEGEIFHVSEG
jgi:hypothetical protein